MRVKSILLPMTLGCTRQSAFAAQPEDGITYKTTHNTARDSTMPRPRVLP